uniref:Protein ENHANCED DISEASE RESISTANCE 2 C-terminal domain-containing protein n=1 Tax=Hirondellea gigas TaxID=1518452 RepID=A0A6A7G975_9CRUS
MEEKRAEPRSLFQSHLKVFNEELGRVDHCWSDPEGPSFKVRGEDYLYGGEKINAGPSQYTFLGLDLVLGTDNNVLSNVGSVPYCSLQKARKRGFKGFVLILNFRAHFGNFLAYWTPSRVLVKRTPEELEADALLKPYQTGHAIFDSLIEQFVEGSDDYRNARLKVIPVLHEGNWVLRQVVSGKPAIICSKIRTVWHRDLSSENNYLEAYIDLSSSKIAVGILSLVRFYVSSVAVDLAFTIEGTADEELPEEILCAFRFYRLNFNEAHNVARLEKEYAEFLSEVKSATNSGGADELQKQNGSSASNHCGNNQLRCDPDNSDRGRVSPVRLSQSEDKSTSNNDSFHSIAEGDFGIDDEPQSSSLPVLNQLDLNHENS